MSKYKFQLKNGKSLTLEGDTQPSDKEVEDIAKEQGVELAPVEDTTPAPKPESINIKSEQYTTPKTTSEPTPETPQPQGWLSKAWHAVSDPLTDIPSRIAKTAADYIDQPSLERSPTMARISGFGAGALQGIGDTISGLTSPINLAATALTGGGNLAEESLPAAANLMKIGGRITSALPAIHGAGQVLNPNSTMGQRGFGLAEIAGGLAGMKGETPEVNPDANINFATKAEADAAKPAITPEVVKPTKTPSTASETTPKTPNYPMGTKVLIKADKSTPEMVKKAMEQGFEFDGVNDQGHFRFVKTNEGKKAPLLESEVGQQRPKLGPSTDEAKSNAVSEVLNLPRAIMASTDMSAPLRQGIGLIHKPEYWKAIPAMFKAWGSEEGFNAIQQNIAEKPLFRERPNPNNPSKPLPSFATDAGLKLTDLHNLSNREEALRSTWAEKIPAFGQLYRKSERAYTGFLNKLRADTFESLIESGKVFGADGTTNVPLARGLADFVNTATGRGSLDFRAKIAGHEIGVNMEPAANVLNTGFFAPRLIASRLKVLNPGYYIFADPMVRKEALKSLFAIAAAGNTVGQIGKMVGGKVVTDPNSSDYGKVQFGPGVRIDPYAGFQQYVVAANRLLRPESARLKNFGTNTGIVPIDMITNTIAKGGSQMNSTVTGKQYSLSNPKYGQSTKLDVAERFAESKANPMLSFAMDMARGKDISGQPFNIPEEVVQRFVPLFLQDLKTLSTGGNQNLIPFIHGKQGAYQKFTPEALPAAIPAWFGMGVQEYGGKSNFGGRGK